MQLYMYQRNNGLTVRSFAAITSYQSGVIFLA